MKKILLLISLYFALCIQSNAQSKVNFSLAKKVNEKNTQILDVFIQGDINHIRQLVTANGGMFKYSAGDIASVKISTSLISQLTMDKSIKRIEAYPQHIKVLNDTVLINNNVIPVHNGQAPLPQAYDGTGVVVGFVDTGIDFTHPDFKDSVGKSRVKFLWDQSKPLAANTPMPYNYGQEWNNLQIDSGLAVLHTDTPYGGHGTHVAGVAVGNGLATGTYKAVAPKADIVFVAADLSSTSTSLISDAVNYIFAKAQILGKPCVINISLGDYYGSHDGLNLEAQLIKNMINLQPGRSVVAAVGNGGTTPYHLGYTVTTDTNFTFFEGSTNIYIPMYADTNDLQNIKFSIGADQFSPVHSFRGNINFSGISTHLGILKSDTLYNAGNRIGIIDSYGDLVGGVYSMEFSITPDSGSYKWRLITTGSGKFDCWTFDVYGGILPSATTMADSIYYKQPDINETTVSSFQCLDDVITVGNYTNRKTYIDYNNSVYVNTATNPGVLHATSSRGPTRDGRIKPDICSPGDMTVAAVVLSMVPGIISGFPDALALGGFHIRNGGSSHASPNVAGVVALYLQRFPTATAAQIKNDIICSAKTDSFTGTFLPDNNWGYGKVNAFGALQGCLTVGISEPSNNISIFIYPNPSNGDQITIDFPGLNLKNKNEIIIYNILGELLKTIAVTRNSIYINSDLKPGVYFCNLIVNGKKVESEKLVIFK